MPMRIVGIFGLLTAAAFAQPQNPQVEIANLREDVRLLSQRVAELGLRVEQLETENVALRRKTESGTKNYATVDQLNAAMADLNALVKAQSQAAAQQQERLAREAAAAAARERAAQQPEAPRAFGTDFPKEGITYTVQKGETLAAIAKKHGAKLQHIIDANKITDPTRVQAGQVLFVPLAGNK